MPFDENEGYLARIITYNVGVNSLVVKFNLQ